MAYGKDDFVDFSDLDLEQLLGEDFTASELESDDECVKKSKHSKSEKTKPEKVYQCDKCDKDYATVSGLRGHLRNKHGITNTRASDYRKGKAPEQKAFRIGESDFGEFFTDAFSETINDMANNKLRQRSTPVGKMVTNVAAKISTDETIRKQLQDKLHSHYFSVFKSASESVGNTNEALYSSFYNVTEDMPLNSEIRDIVKPMSDGNVRPFVGVLLHSLIRTLVKKQSELYTKVSNSNTENSVVSENDQTVIFYVSWYIIQTLGRKSLRKSKASMKQKSLNAAMEECLKKEENCETTFVSKYAEWTHKTNRGGLKIPSDNFFLMIREFEMCCRDEIDEDHESKTMLQKTVLREKVMERFMVKHYSEKLFCDSGEFTSYILESIVNLFLTIRGHAWARKRKSEEVNINLNKKALRKSLMEYTQCQ